MGYTQPNGKCSNCGKRGYVHAAGDSMLCESCYKNLQEIRNEMWDNSR